MSIKNTEIAQKLQPGSSGNKTLLTPIKALTPSNELLPQHSLHHIDSIHPPQTKRRLHECIFDNCRPGDSLSQLLLFHNRTLVRKFTNKNNYYCSKTIGGNDVA